MSTEPDLPILNRKPLEELRTIGARIKRPDLVRSAFLAFRNSAPDRIQALKAGAAQNDPKAISTSAHALNSSSASVGAARVSALCKRIEMLANGGSLEGADELVEAVEGEYSAAVQALEMFLQEPID
ncbi:MAG TPA: Hpt domain-containing protein [Candidatus Sulfotelmatobacter sp.]|nr:Hpt domain-containing protein [Candidatus Sulfotelmatobacter sp.]